MFSPRERDYSVVRSIIIKLAPFNFFKITVGLYRIVPGPPLDPGMQGELLKELHRDYPSLTQIQGGVLFSDPPKGRTLIIDQARVESTETSPRSATQAIERIGDEFQKTLTHVVSGPMPRERIEARRLLALGGGLDPVAVLKPACFAARIGYARLRCAASRASLLIRDANLAASKERAHRTALPSARPLLHVGRVHARRRCKRHPRSRDGARETRIL